MGLLIAIARKAQLNSERFMYEHKQVVISRAKSELAEKITDYEMARSDYEQNSAEAKAMNQRIERLNQIEKRLDEQIQKIQTQLKLIEAEYNMYDNMIQSSLQRFYAH